MIRTNANLISHLPDSSTRERALSISSIGLIPSSPPPPHLPTPFPPLSIPSSPSRSPRRPKKPSMLIVFEQVIKYLSFLFSLISFRLTSSIFSFSHLFHIQFSPFSCPYPSLSLISISSPHPLHHLIYRPHSLPLDPIVPTSTTKSHQCPPSPDNLFPLLSSRLTPPITPFSHPSHIQSPPSMPFPPLSLIDIGLPPSPNTHNPNPVISSKPPYPPPQHSHSQQLIPPHPSPHHSPSTSLSIDGTPPLSQKFPFQRSLIPNRKERNLDVRTAPSPVLL